ncbi:unannotated protein [freshwater metagenome]|uniref:Unannotated protein n=1 Tax=freshwater metagenome TaxID=449393 RepID=A0A6J6LB89_9ZZZZ
MVYYETSPSPFRFGVTELLEIDYLMFATSALAFASTLPATGT